MDKISFLQAGQRVKLLPLEICERMSITDSLGINDSMRHYFGGYVTISRKLVEGRFYIVEDNRCWVWSNEWIDVKASFPDLFVNKKQEV